MKSEVRTSKPKWRSVAFGDLVADTQYGTAAKANTNAVGVPVLRMNNITYSGALDLSELKHVELAASELDQYSVQRGDLLFNRTNSQELVGKMGVWDRNESFAFAGYLVRVRLKCDQADPKYAAAWFNTPAMKALLRSRAKPSINMANINATELLEFPIVVPPLAEQRRIAEVLDRAEALRAKRRAVLAQLDSLTQSLFLDLFGDPVTNERNWPRRTVSDFVAGFESGKNVVADDKDDTTSPFRVLKVSAVTSLEFHPEESKAAPAEHKPPTSHFVRAGDLLFSRANTSELIGATALVRGTPTNLLLPDKLWRFVWHQTPRADPHFVRFLFQHPKFRSEIGKRATGTSGSMKNISQEKVLSIEVGLPPLPLQQTFARRVAAVERLKTSHRAALAHLDALFASLQHRAFRGEL